MDLREIGSRLCSMIYFDEWQRTFGFYDQRVSDHTQFLDAVKYSKLRNAIAW